MYELLEAVKNVICRDVLQRQTLTQAASQGDTSITVGSNRRFQNGSQVAIHNGARAETHYVSQPEANRTNHTTGLILDTAMTAFFPVGSVVEKLYEGYFVDDVVIGNPPNLPRTPVIKVSFDTNESEPLALGGMLTTDYHVYITTICEAASYSDGYRLIHKLTPKIESALRRATLVIDPCRVTTLAEPANEGDTLIRITDPDAFYDTGAFIYLQTEDDGPYCYKVVEALGNGVLQLAYALGLNYPVGTQVIRPWYSVYHTFAHNAEYRDTEMVMASRIEYTVSVASHRGQTSL